MNVYRENEAAEVNDETLHLLSPKRRAPTDRKRRVRVILCVIVLALSSIQVSEHLSCVMLNRKP